MIKKQRIINLISKNNSLNGDYNSNLYFNIPNLYKKNQSVLYSSIQVLSAQIPLSYYLINETNNKFILNGDEYFLTKGNYNANNFINMFQNIIPLQLNIDLVDLKFTLSSINNFTFKSNLGYVMGFENNVLYSSINNSFTCPYICDFIGIKRINIFSSELSNDNIDVSDVTNDDLLCSVPINSDREGIILYNNFSNIECFLNKSNVNIFDIKLFDDDKNFINFNGKLVYMTLLLNIYTNEKPNINYRLNELPEPEPEPQEENLNN